MDSELLYSKFYQALKEKKYLDAKSVIYEAHREGMPAGHIIVKIINRALEQMHKSALAESSVGLLLDFSAESKKYFECLIAADKVNARKVIDNAIKHQVSPSDILLKIVSPAMDEIGVLQSRQQISLSQIFIASKITEETLDRVLPLMPARPVGLGKIILGNAFGDYHALGRKILGTFLRFYGFDVIDLGLSVPNEKFVEYAIKENASLIFVSALLLHTAKHILELRKLLIERGLTRIKIVGGGGPFNFDKELYKQMGCDATAPNGITAVQVAKKLLGVA